MGTDTQGKAEARPPKYLYRYLDRFGLAAIFNLELKMTPPNEFNDPFEFTPRLGSFDDEWEAVLKRAKKVKPNITLDEVKKTKLKEELDKGAPQEFRKAASRHFSVLCLSAKPDIPTQWGHYSDKHKGLVLELNMNAGPLGQYEILRVRYCRPERKVKQHLWSALEECEKDKLNLLKQVLRSCGAEKGPEWCLEKEHRLIATLPEMEARLVGDRLMYFLKLNIPAAIKRVILGGLVTEEFETEVRIAAARHKIAVVRAKLDYRSLTVSIPQVRL